MWTCSFKIRVKIEIKEHLSVRLTSQTTEFTAYVAGYVFFVGSTFHFGFIITLKTLLFREIYLGIYAKPRQTHSELVLQGPPMDQIRRTSISR